MKRPIPMHAGEVNDENIRSIFRNAADFNARSMQCDGHTIYTYAIDGLTSGSDISEYVYKPIMENLHGKTMEILYHNALDCVVNAVAKPCVNLDDVSFFLEIGRAHV